MIAFPWLSFTRLDPDPWGRLAMMDRIRHEGLRKIGGTPAASLGWFMSWEIYQSKMDD